MLGLDPGAPIASALHYDLPSVYHFLAREDTSKIRLPFNTLEEEEKALQKIFK